MNRVFSDDSKKIYYYLIYTALFIIVAVIAFYWFWSQGRELIWQDDGWAQHYKAFTYLGEYLRGGFGGLPEWNFHIGEGNDVLSTLHYYVIGDPVSLLSALIPKSLSYHAFSALTVLRMYLSGIAFSLLAFGTGRKNRFAVLTGALSYCFCYWALFCASRHPFFLNPMIYFPLIILGIEKLIRGERPYLLIFATAVSAFSNFYFFYILVLLTIVYAFVRLILLYKKKVKELFLTLLKIAAFAAVGACIAGIILVPAIMTFLGDSRLSASQPFHLFYPLQYYSQLPAAFITKSTSYWLCIGLSVPAFVSLPVLFIKDRNRKILKILFIICIIFMIFPIFGRIFNGMSYMSNRWVFALSLLCCYILVCEWKNMMELGLKEWIITVICCTVFMFLCLGFEKSNLTSTRSVLPLIFIMVFLTAGVILKTKQWIKQILILVLACVSILNVAYWRFSPAGDNYSEELKTSRSIEEETVSNEALLLRNMTDAAYPRYTGRDLSRNENMANQISSTQYFWTLSNPYLNEFRHEMELREELDYKFEGYDDRTALIGLSSVSYYITDMDNDAGLPYGFVPSGESFTLPDGRQRVVYENEYPLPAGYCYDSVVSEEQWNALDPVQKQEVMLKAAYIGGQQSAFSEYSGDIADYSIPYELECLQPDITIDSYQPEGLRPDISTDGSRIITTAPDAQLSLSFDSPSGSETYIALEGLDFTPAARRDLYSDDRSIDPNDLYNEEDWNALSDKKRAKLEKEKKYMNYQSNITITFQSSAGAEKTLVYRSPDASFSSGRHDYIVNLGYMDEPVTSVTVSFPETGSYQIEELKVYSIPMDDYAEDIGALAGNSLGKISLDNNTISGELTLDREMLLVMAIPYSKGWKAFVDGQETPVMEANIRYIGITVPAGEHILTFSYSSPYKGAGLIVTCIGIILLLIVIAKKPFHDKRDVSFVIFFKKI